jgi:hypothetical protein
MLKWLMSRTYRTDRALKAASWGALRRGMGRLGTGMMELHGTIAANLRAAVASAERLQGHPVYKDTLAYWTDLLHKARRARDRDVAIESDEVDQLILKLETALAARSRP